MEVDAFGRMRPPGARREPLSPPRGGYGMDRGRDMHRDRDRDRGMDRERDRGFDRPHEAGRRRYSSASPPRGGPSKRPRHEDDHRDRGSRDRDRPIDRDPRGRRRPRALPPMLCYHDFKRDQDYGTPAEECQRRYEQYQLQYAQDVSDHFFDTHKHEEWFVDRYDPLRVQEREEGVRQWARDESAALGRALASAPLPVLRACCLEPQGAEPAPLLAATAGDSAAPAEGTTTGIDDSGKHIPGHKDRTVYISGIPASCPRAAVENGVREALEAAAGCSEGAVPGVDRLLLAQPSWRRKEQAMSFEKNAWVVLAPGADVKAATRVLQEHRFKCPGPPDSTGQRSEGFLFRVTAHQHSFKGVTVLPAHMSEPARVASDTGKAAELAELLDAERGVPAESRLAALLSPRSSPALVAAMRQPTDVLDLAVAYLRRVHFVLFYAGMRFHDEAHLLTFPYLFARGAPYSLPRPPLPSSGLPAATTPLLEGGEDATLTPAETIESREAPAEDKAVEEEQESSYRRRRRSSSAEEGEDGGWSSYGGGADTAARDGADGDSMFRPLSGEQDPGSKSGEDSKDEEAEAAEETDELDPAVRLASDKLENWRGLVKAARSRIVATAVDRRIQHLMDELSARAARGGGPDEEDAKALREIYDELQEAFVAENCSIQEDGRARCGVEACGKLFKNTEFLVKHIRSKHMALADMRIIEKSVSYTRVRFEADSLGRRPLPLIELDTGRSIETRSVRAVVQEAHARLVALEHGDGPDRRRHSEGGRGGRGRRDGGQRGQWNGPPPGQPMYPPGGAQPPLPPGRAPVADGTPARQLSYYVDVDEPQESTPMDLDYGVAVLPPPKKKRKSLGGGGTPASKEKPVEGP